MIGVESPKRAPGNPAPGNHRLPLSCSDRACKSFKECLRPENEGPDGNFHRNRDGKDRCACFQDKRDQWQPEGA